MFHMREWAPDGMFGKDDSVIMSMDPKDFRYLWFDAMLELWVKLPEDDPRGFAAPLGAVVGDIWLVQFEEGSSEPRLIFIGPKTEERSVHVLADWEVRSERDLGAGRGRTANRLVLAHLFQPGPGRRTVSGQKSVYEHLRKPSV